MTSRDRDIVGALLLFLGVIVLLGAAFLTDVRLGIAAVGVLFVAAGAALAYDRRA